MMIFAKGGQVKRLNSVVTRLLLVAVLTAFSSNMVIAQTQYKLHISRVEIPEEKQKNWLGLPTHVDFVVTWDLYVVQEGGKLESVDDDGDFDYKVYMAKDDSAFQNVIPVDVKGQHRYTFKDNEVNKIHYFRIDGLREGNVVVKSDVASAIGGKRQKEAKNDGPDGDENVFPIPMFFPVAEIFQLAGCEVFVYTKSSLFGKISFTLVWYFFIIGIFLVFKQCMPHLSLKQLFPLSRTIHRKMFARRDQIFDKCQSPRFMFFIEAWKKVITKSHDLTRDVKAKNAEETEKMHFDYFKQSALPALDALRDMLQFKPSEGNKNALVEKLAKYFGPEGEFGDLMNGKMSGGTLYENADLRWNAVESELIDQKAKPLDRYATVKLLLAGLENHIVNGYSWQKVSEEVDRAVDNRANSEIENLRSTSSVEWLWNMGAMAPLLGLFGTITGISEVFKNITNMKTELNQQNLVTQLSGGIFEALYTTIYGLIVGIILMLLYYRYKNNLEWIKNKWQWIYVRITEKM